MAEACSGLCSNFATVKNPILCGRIITGNSTHRMHSGRQNFASVVSPQGREDFAPYSAPTPIPFGMDAFKKGWYTETGSLYSDQALSMKVEKILYHKKSKYQDILIFESTIFGRVLVLDDSVQLTEFDECSYQEMISFLPLNSHPNPKKVLVIGGGDGGVVREAVKHPSVESVTLCELDEEVIEVSKKYLPFMAKGFDSPKLTLYIGDGAEFVKNHPNEFDVIITDSPDPKGPAVCLFQKPYYESLKQALKPGGLIASQ
ncbi:spermidine synthase, partial [Trichonephila inaurata madagascariensis]